jgi:hypothetical protein
MPTLQDDWIAPPGPPHSYLAVANNLMNGIRVLATHGGVATAIPLSMLCAHALECALKALLSETGSVRADLRNSHDISKLWEAANGSVPMPAWAGELSDLHAPPFHLRYLDKVNGVVTPAARPMVDELERMIEAADKKLRGI